MDHAEQADRGPRIVVQQLRGVVGLEVVRELADVCESCLIA